MSRMWILTLCATLAVGVCSAQAAFRVDDGFDEPLGDSGWRIQGPGYCELQLAIDDEGVTDDIKWVAISISKNFRFGPDPFTGLYPAIELDFMQMEGVAREDLATRIIITSEMINNSTGTDWLDYHWRLYGHGIAMFNRELTNPTVEVAEDEHVEETELLIRPPRMPGTPMMSSAPRNCPSSTASSPTTMRSSPAAARGP